MEPVTRKYITETIREVCQDKWGLAREDLGVYAADRAQMYFRGEVYDVGIEEKNRFTYHREGRRR